jgi:bifunctional UDP-N-acetylglucosamine pyrophosphorylase/glucosamine-1-phosphate N-acetyltransferase
MKTTAVILAAGLGTRMRSRLPKVLHPLAGKPMLQYILDVVNSVTDTKPVLVVGHGAEQVQKVIGDAARYVLQEPQLGTGHAVMQAQAALQDGTELVLVATADMPLLSQQTVRQLVEAQANHIGPISMLTVMSQDPRGFGRIVRDAQGNIQAIVEESQASPEQLQIHELNTGVYCFRADWLWESLPRIPLSPKGEYFLTDLVAIAAAEGQPVRSFIISDPVEGIGVNNRVHLSEVEAILRRRINQHWMLSGVTLVDPASTYIDAGVEIGMDTVIWPNTYLQGKTVIGEDCQIGPNTVLRDTQVGNGCKLVAVVADRARLEDRVEAGPFARLRKGAHLAEGVHMGNFGEVKNSYLGPGTKMGHFSYIGDAQVGADVNIGAGTITCNYDGERKHPTEIGANAFIGSDTMLVAPVKIGEGARTGAGAVVTKDVPNDTLAVGMPARAIKKLGKRD